MTFLMHAQLIHFSKSYDSLFSLIVKHSIAMMKALPEMFPSPVAPPKKMGQAREAMLHILEVRHALTLYFYKTNRNRGVVMQCSFIFVFVFLANRKPRFLPQGETTLLSRSDCV